MKWSRNYIVAGALVVAGGLGFWAGAESVDVARLDRQIEDTKGLIFSLAEELDRRGVGPHQCDADDAYRLARRVEDQCDELNDDVTGPLGIKSTLSDLEDRVQSLERADLYR